MKKKFWKVSQFVKGLLKNMATKRNVNVIGTVFSQSLPCFLCGDTLEMRTSKKNKPFFVCDDCGTQFFVRKKLGIERLEELIGQIKETGLTGTKPEMLIAIQQRLSEIEGLKKEIKKTEDAMGFFPNDTLIRVRNSLEKRLGIVLSDLEELSGQKPEEITPETNL